MESQVPWTGGDQPPTSGGDQCKINGDRSWSRNRLEKVKNVHLITWRKQTRRQGETLYHVNQKREREIILIM